jgi:hypothetical protein
MGLKPRSDPDSNISLDPDSMNLAKKAKNKCAHLRL